MGLDSYVFRIKKLQRMEPRVYTRDELDQLKLAYFLKEEPEEELVKQLMPYCQVIQVKTPLIDIQKIRAEHSLSDDAYVCMHCGNGDIGLIDPKNEKAEMLTISGDEIQSKYLFEKTLPYCVYHSEEVSYWRKNYRVQDFFYENLEHVENTGFYLLDAEVVTDFNLKFGGDLGELPLEAPTDDQALFYYEWY